MLSTVPRVLGTEKQEDALVLASDGGGDVHKLLGNRASVGRSYPRFCMLTDSASLSSRLSVDRSGNLSPFQDVSQVLFPVVAGHRRKGQQTLVTVAD